jgi:hypothetical protein
MLIEPSTLPTPIAHVARRLNVAGGEAFANTFLAASYLAEAAIKMLAITLYAGLRERGSDHAYRIGHQLVRADGLGMWEVAIRDSTTQPLVGFLPPEMNALVTWANKIRTKTEDEWFKRAQQALDRIFEALDIENVVPERKPTARNIIAALVQIRNKTKAHGAVAENFYSIANEPYIEAIQMFLDNCPIFNKWQWFHLLPAGKGNIRLVFLHGESPHHVSEKDFDLSGISQPGVYFRPDQPRHLISCADLLRSDLECSTFLFPNGGYSASGEAWFINYGTGYTSRQEVLAFIRSPVPLPPSETHGLDLLDVQSNVFGNLPQLPDGYVLRRKLEKELELRLRDKNHPIITLHGRGGIGKTSLALKVAHQLAGEANPHFEYVVWFSARDVDLRPTGPISVKPAVINLEMISRIYGTLFEVEGNLENFAKILTSPQIHSQKGILFIFDNFETMTDVRGLHQFLDTYTHLPNKTMITTRERAFKADFPIEVLGMEYDEASEMLKNLSNTFSIQHMINEDIIKNIYEYSEGHPYVMRILLGEILKEGKYVPVKTVLSRRVDIVNTVFERSFIKLSEDSKRVFLTIANGKSTISELALVVVLGRRNIDVEAAIEECRRFSLISQVDYLDDQPAYFAPQIAQLFARKKLEGDPDRLLIQEDLSILRGFGVISTSQPIQIPQRESIRHFIDWCHKQADPNNAEKIRHTDLVLESLAELWPEAWMDLVTFRMRYGFEHEQVDYASRRAVEENPSSRQAWLQRAYDAKKTGDEATFISSRVRAVELEPSNVGLIYEVAYDLCRYISEHVIDIPVHRRSIYLASVREHMVNISARLDATGLSRLAWLYLLERNETEAWRYASQGLTKEKHNPHCWGIIDRLRRSGFTLEEI